ncbi:MAG: hypothetical protein JSS96_09085 [Bacteroidetes bacterium]|nr:hypothetical protein [Bacteroidota bacterium]
MEPSKLRQAHDLYFQTDMSQSQIAELLNINRKTLYLWMKESNWQQVKRSARHTPSILAEQYYQQLAAINEQIATREEQPYPTREEAEIIRKLTLTIGRIKTGQTVSEHIETMTRFLELLKTEAPSLLEEVLPHTDKFIKKAKFPSAKEEVLQELQEEISEAQSDTPAIPAPRQLFQTEINLPELKTKIEDENITEEVQIQTVLNISESNQVVPESNENETPDLQLNMGHNWGINSRIDDPESQWAQYLEQKYTISHDPYISRHRGITIIRAGSPLWGRDKPLWW